jgi:hypothetical protein
VPDLNDVPRPAPPFDELELEQRVLRAATASASQQQQADDDLDPRILAEARGAPRTLASRPLRGPTQPSPPSHRPPPPALAPPPCDP